MAPKDGLSDQFNNSIRLADTYSESTGMPLQVINSQGEVVYQTGNYECGLCKKARSLIGERLNCSKSHLYASYQAERFGGKYVFFCQLGLTHWVSPVLLNENETGSFVAGPVLMVDPDDFLFEDLLRKHLKTEHIEDVLAEIDKVPVVSPDKVDHLSNLLFVIGAYSFGEGADYLSETRQILEQQADISQYIHSIKTMGGTEEATSHYPIEKERELLTLISSGDHDGARKVLNEILGTILLKSGVSFEVIKARVLELVVVLSRAAVEGGADIEQVFGLNYKYLNDINQFKSAEELMVWLSKIMRRFSAFVFGMKDVKHADVIYKALNYISKNYMRKISLEEVAATVYLSPSYFSKIFKEETGTNFVTYLNSHRISVSKRLLMDNSIDIADISYLVGYEDQSYFTKSFKKMTGITPGKFRESRGQTRLSKKEEGE